MIETIITPKDGFRLTLKNSKVAEAEEYSVEALEVVSFGSAQFFRSQEKPKTFLLPIADYEVVETREAKIVLKNPVIEKTIKIAGGKEPHVKVVKHEPLEVIEAVEPQEEEKEVVFEKRKDKKRNRRKKSQEQRQHEKENIEVKASQEAQQESADDAELTPHPIPVFATLLPPPTMLISETIARYKAMDSYDKFMIHKEEPGVAHESQELPQAQESLEEEVLDRIWDYQQPEESFVSLAHSDIKEESPSNATALDEMVEDGSEDVE